MSFLVSDLALIRRLNRSLIEMGRAYGEAKAALAPGSPCAVLPVAGGAACFFGAGDPLNETVGLGLEGPVEAAEIEAIERFYAEQGGEAKFWVAPGADPSVLDHLGARGYRLVDLEQVWVRPLGGALPESTGLVETCTPDQYEAWVAGWLEGFDLPAEYGLFGRAMCEVPGTVPCWVREEPPGEGRPVAVANLTMRDGVALFFGTATLPGFRGRGYQTALLQERLRMAQAAGCDLAIVETAAANGSARNCERAGFRLLYTKVKLAK